MDVNAIMQIIGTVGFPIACCMFMFWRETKFMDQIKSTLDEVKTTVDNNSKIIQHFLDKEGTK